MHSYFIIENHQTTIKIIQEILEEQGEYYCIGTSDDYEEGMNLILKHHPDMVFINIDQVDINTPDVFAYCREMQNYITNKIFFIALSNDERKAYQALKNKRLEWNGSKNALREFIHVEDAADCAVRILDSKYINQHIILTGHQSLTINNLFIMIQEILSKENITFNFLETSSSEHYKTTPYIFSPKFGKKLNPDNYIDLGQGLTQMAEEIYEQINNERK